jgi:AcrR family transcriptional regulator
MSIYDSDRHIKRATRAGLGDAVTIEPLTPARRREMTRRHLLEAAAVVFARDGFHGASLDDVAATAGFTKGAVYSNFKSKEDLFLALFDDRLVREAADMQQVLADPVAGDGRVEQLPRVQGVIERLWDDDWTALYLEFVLYAKRNPAVRERLAAVARREYESTIRMLEGACASIDGTPNFPVPVLAKVSIAIFEGLTLGRFIDPALYTQETITEALTFLYDTIGVNPNN